MHPDTPPNLGGAFEILRNGLGGVPIHPLGLSGQEVGVGPYLRNNGKK